MIGLWVMLLIDYVHVQNDTTVGVISHGLSACIRVIRPWIL